MGRAKWKSVFEHAQNAQIQIHPMHAQSFVWHLLPIGTFYSVQWFFEQTAKTLIKLHRCSGWSGPLLSAYTWRHIHGATHINLQYVYTLALIVDVFLHKQIC